MKTSIVLSFLSNLLGMVQSPSPGPPSHADSTISKRAPNLVFLTFDIVPPLTGTFCGQTWNGTIKLNHKHQGSDLTTGCRDSYDYIYPATGENHTEVEWVWICPDDVHGSIPAAPKDPKNSHPTKFTLVGDVYDPYTYAEDSGNAMAMFNVTDNSLKPPVDMGNVQVQVGYEHPGDKRDFSKLSIKTLICM